VIDDMWFQWVTYFALPSPDRGEGGRYLFVPPGYTGELPERGFFVQKMRTTLATMLGRSFLENSDPKSVAALIKKTLKAIVIFPVDTAQVSAQGFRHSQSLGPSRE
jgi:hypothetical protein